MRRPGFNFSHFGMYANDIAKQEDFYARVLDFTVTGWVDSAQPILILAILRFAWRIVIPGPVNDADRQGWQTQIAYATEYIFYFCFFGLPLSGWAMWSSVAAPGPLYLAGFIPWPQLPLQELPLTSRWAVMDVAEDVHHVLVWTLMILVPLHVLAALKHHFWNRHDVLRGMLPEIPDEENPRATRRRMPRGTRSRGESGAG